MEIIFLVLINQQIFFFLLTQEEERRGLCLGMLEPQSCERQREAMLREGGGCKAAWEAHTHSSCLPEVFLIAFSVSFT